MAALAVLAVALGAIATVQLRGAPHPPFDPWFHLELARQWRAGTGLSSSAEISAGYPLFVAGVDLLRPSFFGLPLALGLAQSILLGVNVVLTALLGRRVGSPAIGVAAAAAVAVWPNLVLAAPLALAETLTITCALGVVVLLSSRPRPSTGQLATAGALVALGAELRPGLILLLALFVTLPASGGGRERLRDLAVGLVVAAALIAPFALRSSYVARSFVPLDLRAGVNLCLGRAPGADHPPVDRSECPVPDDATALEANDLRMDQAWEMLRSDPWREPGLVVVRGRVTLWDADRSSADELARQDGHHLGASWDTWFDRASTLLSRLTLVLAAIGTVIAVLRRNGPVLRVAAAAVLLLVPALTALGDARYRMPAIPFLVVVALTALRRPRAEPAPEPSSQSGATG